MNAELRALVIDDEPIARQIITAYIERTPGIVAVGECGNALDAFAQLSHTDADVLFLDISMPEISGLQLARALPAPRAVVFITAHAEHAVESYEIAAVDYLLKPVSYERFCRAVEKARATVFPSKPAVEISSVTPPQALLLKTDGRLLRMETDKILFIEALRDYVRYHTTDGPIVVHSTMKATEKSFSELHHIIRIHKSYFINIQHLQEVRSTTVRLASRDIPIGATYREAFMHALALFRTH